MCWNGEGKLMTWTKSAAHMTHIVVEVIANRWKLLAFEGMCG
jgi:hypothetical protein